MNGPAHIRYVQRPDATPKAELGALASAYRFVLECRAKKEAAPESRPDDGTKVKEDSANVSSLPD
jgi:hypothetical protein